ncbi:hypothetical protein M0R45_015679 [Rubus argutus]|uniref:Water stress and hypersensitive response domain-containing protein n=1 Tax=Rubus argutus TaxID=59490 RepID=A0AAW1XST8_RUBAR
MARPREVKWSWSSALIGAASAVAATALLSAKPKDPTFHLVSFKLTSFKLNIPVLDANVMLTVHVTNPNITPIHYSPPPCPSSTKARSSARLTSTPALRPPSPASCSASRLGSTGSSWPTTPPASSPTWPSARWCSTPLWILLVRPRFCGGITSLWSTWTVTSPLILCFLTSLIRKTSLSWMFLLLN